MFKAIKSAMAISIFIFLINGCTSNTISKKEFSYRESLLVKANNYGGLINLYREKLKIREDDTVRIKLANAYYLAGDSKSSLYYLQSVSDKKNESFYLIQTKNLINQNKVIAAKIAVKELLTISPNNAEAHNLNGIILANSGETKKAEKAFEQSRSLFINDETAMNNIAVVAMLDNRYTDAVRILLPDYLSGNKNSLILHNLVFSLIKLGGKQYAKKIIIAEKMANEPDELLLALSQVEHLHQIKLSNEGV